MCTGWGWSQRSLLPCQDGPRTGWLGCKHLYRLSNTFVLKETFAQDILHTKLQTFYQFPQCFSLHVNKCGEANTQDKGFNPVFIPYSWWFVFWNQNTSHKNNLSNNLLIVLNNAALHYCYTVPRLSLKTQTAVFIDKKVFNFKKRILYQAVS